MTRFKTASEAFDYFLPTIRENGVDFAGTKSFVQRRLYNRVAHKQLYIKP
jgi:hypothetical protein